MPKVATQQEAEAGTEANPRLFSPQRIAQAIAALAAGGAPDWGDIGGTLSDQTDLQAALDGKAASAHASSHQSGGGDAIKLDDLAVPDDNTDLDASTSKHGLCPKFPGGTTNFLRADGQFAAPGGGSGPITVKELTSDFTSPGTTMGKATGLDQTIAAGTYWFEYRCIWRSSATATAVKFGVNFSGTQTVFVVEATGYEATTAASTGAVDQTHTAFGLRARRSEQSTQHICFHIRADISGHGQCRHYDHHQGRDRGYGAG